jgi:hypothetical protein
VLANLQETASDRLIARSLQGETYWRNLICYDIFPDRSSHQLRLEVTRSCDTLSDNGVRLIELQEFRHRDDDRGIFDGLWFRLGLGRRLKLRLSLEHRLGPETRISLMGWFRVDVYTGLHLHQGQGICVVFSREGIVGIGSCFVLRRWDLKSEKGKTSQRRPISSAITSYVQSRTCPGLAPSACPCWTGRRPTCLQGHCRLRQRIDCRPRSADQQLVNLLG